MARPEPAHAVRQPRRAEADLRVFEALAGGAEHLVGGDAQVFDLDLGMAAGHRAVDRIEHAHRADRGIRQVDQEHAGAVVRLRHDDADLGAFGAGDELLAPLMTQ